MSKLFYIHWKIKNGVVGMTNARLHKKKLLILLSILGFIGILDTLIISFFVTGLDFGVVFPGAAGVLLLVFCIIKLRIGLHKPIIKNKLLSVCIFTIIVIWLISFAVIEFLIVYNSASDMEQEVDYLIILGAGLNGEEPSLTLQERLHKGVEYLNKYTETKVIVSGGQGRGERITEAEAMKRFLIDKGIDKERIIKEDKSTSTMENFVFSKKLIIAYGGSEKSAIAIITNDFHIMRSKMLARRNGIKPYAISCRTPLSVLPNCYIREYFAVVKSYLIDHV
jgi:uncharacterized SAM-binding protein YcdF (DUF218 family)